MRRREIWSVSGGFGGFRFGKTVDWMFRSYRNATRGCQFSGLPMRLALRRSAAKAMPRKGWPCSARAEFNDPAALADRQLLDFVRPPAEKVPRSRGLEGRVDQQVRDGSKRLQQASAARGRRSITILFDRGGCASRLRSVSSLSRPVMLAGARGLGQAATGANCRRDGAGTREVVG